MNQFYSIVKISPNAATQDSIAVGILLFKGNRIWSYFSANKRKIASKLISVENLNLNALLKQIEEKCAEINQNNQRENGVLLENNQLNANYFNYLERYANGLLQFSAPIPFIGEMDGNKFEALTIALFNEKKIIQQPAPVLKNDFSEIINTKLILRVKETVHTNIKLTRARIPEIYFNSFEMDCIGKNGAIIGAKSLSFEKSAQTLDTHLGHYFTLISTLSNKYHKALKDNSFFLIAEEPTTIPSEEHQLWESIRKNKLITVISPEESGKVADLIEIKGATKFLD